MSLKTTIFLAWTPCLCQMVPGAPQKGRGFAINSLKKTRFKGTANGKKGKMQAVTKIMFDQLIEDSMKLMDNGDYGGSLLSHFDCCHTELKLEGDFLALERSAPLLLCVKWDQRKR